MGKRLNINITSDKTLNTIYKDIEVNPDEIAIVLALENGKRIPISREYDDLAFCDALKDIAMKIDTQGIHVGNIIGNRYTKDALHHFETLPRTVADDLETSLFNTASYRK